jgi:hypothetical protein
VAIGSAVAATVLSAVPLSAADATVPRLPRVRANGNAAIAVLLLAAQRRCAVFRRLVDTIDGIVYTEYGPCNHGFRHAWR